MGSFSWLKADNLTNIANIVVGKPFKFLIPQEFGGGFIKDYYQDYGKLGIKEDGTPKYDMYEIVAFWNAYSTNPFDGEKLISILKYNNDFPKLKEIDEYTDENRSIGIEISCYAGEIDKLKFPLKLVSASYKGTYEDCIGKSYRDPHQGQYALKRSELNKVNIF